MATKKRGKEILDLLHTLADKETANHSQRFFKTGKDEYGEGDEFLGIRVPVLRKIAKQHADISLPELETILSSKFHEARLLGIFCLIIIYQKGNDETQRSVFDWYVNNTKYINNWDIIDSSADKIVGHYLFHREKNILYQFADSNDLWQKRIAIMATYYFIKQNQFEDTLAIAKHLLNDDHDLIHKAVGWMLREIGNRNQNIEEQFLKRYYQAMPRTMLRYAIEKFDEDKRQNYLKGLV